MTPFSSKQLNFFKFANVVFKEFPPALRRVFVHMWNAQGFQPWDDSPVVRKMFLAKEGGKTKNVPTDKSYKEWDCTALFEATLYAQSFAQPIPGRKGGTLADLYVKPRRLPSGAFHPSVTSPTSNDAETFALALDQLRLLRNSLCHKRISEIDKKTFDQYIQLAKDAFAALKQSFTKIDDIGKLAEKDFPTERVQQLENELRREKLQMIASVVTNLETVVTDVKEKVDDAGSDVKYFKTEVKCVRTNMENVETEVKYVKTLVGNVVTKVEKDVKDGATAIKSTMENVGSAVKDVKTGIEDVKTSVEDVGLNVFEVKTRVADVKTTVSDVESDVKEVKNGVASVGSDVADVKMGLKGVETKVEALESYLKLGMTDVQSKVEKLESELKLEQRAGVEAMKQAPEATRSNGHVIPLSCVPDEIPHFYGRQKECDVILGHLMGGGNTRVVDIWGSPGFGKTSVAINIAHHLRENEIPVYFISLRGMKSKDEIVSKLLSIFANAKHVPGFSLSHWLTQCLQQLQNPFVLILDNADDVLESKDTKFKDEVLRFSKEILAQCCNVKLLFTTRESLDFWKHEVPIHLERVGVLDEISSAKLVKSLLPDISENECTKILKECGQVPLAMRLMCSIMGEENVSLHELLKELKTSTLVEVLDNELFPHDSRLKSLINTSFQRLSRSEREAFVSLTVFPGNFQKEEAMDVLRLKATEIRKILRALEAKSLIESHDSFLSFTIHSLLRSFIHEKTCCDVATKDTFHRAQIRFDDYNIKKFETATDKFFTGRSNDAVETFVSRRESIIKSLVNGTKEDELFTKTTQVLSKAEVFIFSLLPDEESTFNRLYDIAVEEAQKRKDCDMKRNLLAAKFFGCLGWYYAHLEDPICPLQYYDSFIDAADCPPKLLCYFGIYKILCGKLKHGISFLERFVDLPIYDYNEEGLMILAHHVLAVFYRNKDDDVKASHFETTCSVKIDSASFSPAFCSLFVRETPSSRRSNSPCLPESVVERDAFLFSLTAELLPSIYKALGDQIEIELSVMISISLLRTQKVLLALFKEGRVHGRVLETCCLGLSRLNCYKEAAEGFQMISSQSENATENPGDLARNFHSLGLAQNALKEYDAARFSFKRAFEMRTKLLLERQITAVISNTIDSLVMYAAVLENAEASIADSDIHIVIAGCEKLDGLVAEEKEQDFSKACFYKLGVVLVLVSVMCLEREDYSKALELIQWAKRMEEENEQDIHVTSAKLALESIIYLEMERYVEAENSVHSAIDLCKRSHIEEHVDHSHWYSLLGKVYLKQDKYNKALNAHLQSLLLRKKHLESDIDPLIAASFHEIGCTLYKMRSYEQAVKQLKKAVDLRKLLLGIHAAETSLSFKCLFHAQYSLGHVSDAVATLQLLVCTYEALDDHENTAWCYDTIGKLRLNMGDLSEALETTQKALRVRSEVSSNHPDTASTIHRLGIIYYKMRDFESALEDFQRAVLIRRELLGDHEDTACSYHCLGVTQSSMKDHISASTSLKLALEMRTKLLWDHIDTARSLHNLGINYLAMGENCLALEVLEKATYMRTRLLGDHEDTAKSYLFLGVVQMKNGDLSGALESLQKSVQQWQKRLGDRLDTAAGVHSLALDYAALSSSLGRLEKAANMWSQLLGCHEDVMCGNQWLAKIQECVEEAVEFLQKAFEFAGV